MRLGFYIIFMFSLSFVALIAGFKPPAFTCQTCSSAPGVVGVNNSSNPTPLSITDIMNNVLTFMVTTNGLIVVGAAVLAGALGGGVISGLLNTNTGFAAIYIIPALVAGSIFAMNIFIFPTSTIITSDLPPYLSLGLTAVFNIFMLLSIVEFTIGRS